MRGSCRFAVFLAVILAGSVFPAAARRPARLEACASKGLIEDCWLYSPCELKGDFDGDRRPDRAVLVAKNAKGPKGVTMLFASGRCALAGAGKDAGANGPDMKWVANWSVSPDCPEQAKGACLMLLVAEASGQWLYWDGKRVRVEEISEGGSEK